ncbi:hypothetical protein Smic_58000 [Streptomyces microflavus]|uniref:Uncharacterized protein n=1 Tax=Streptomyces microflavus TaxID=1919 RepID=A0A7J0CZA4_STRMI|nr:hypothetical protein Smic_58000 [Streptomyces microflavus]
MAVAAKQRDRTHYLYIAVIAAVALGILVGFVAPGWPSSSSPSAPAS